MNFQEDIVVGNNWKIFSGLDQFALRERVNATLGTCLDWMVTVGVCACSFGCLRYCADIEMVGISVDIAGNWMEWSNKACAGDD